jgi:hypothetical protein
MNWLLILLLLSLCIWLMLVGVSRPGKIYEYPFLAGATFLGFVLPQLPALANDPFLPPDAFARTALFTILCATMCGVGWAAGKRPFRAMRWDLDERCLLWVAAILSLAGAFFYFKISHLPAELLPTNQIWTGSPVMYLFFARLLTYGLAIAALCFARCPSKFALCIILFDTFFYMDRILIAGRRSEAADFILIIALAAWFHRGIAVPRTLALIGVVAGTLALVSTGDYRSISHDREDQDWSEVAHIDAIENFQALLERGGPEMRNAILRIHAVNRSLNFDYGLFHWNTLVFNFVPAQIVGSEIKTSLIIPFDGQHDLEYDPPTGSTETGMADAFASFWYFGALKFFLLAYLLGRIYCAATGGHTIFRLLYVLSLTPSMLAITHHTQSVLSTWVHMALLFLPLLALARVKTRPCGGGSRPHVSRP